ncbi:hypothetical protein Tco_0800006 [Tanacetum coccineum]|uniref:Uncharacterized protein n=1 Tax=Tanacetum coccineum TaxID=301880 RepID=A0ABQ4ZWB4_9ASTR
MIALMALLQYLMKLHQCVRVDETEPGEVEEVVGRVFLKQLVGKQQMDEVARLSSLSRTLLLEDIRSYCRFDVGLHEAMMSLGVGKLKDEVICTLARQLTEVAAMAYVLRFATLLSLYVGVLSLPAQRRSSRLWQWDQHGAHGRHGTFGRRKLGPFGRTRHGLLRRTTHGVVGRRKHRPFRMRKHWPFQRRRKVVSAMFRKFKKNLSQVFGFSLLLEKKLCAIDLYRMIDMSLSKPVAEACKLGNLQYTSVVYLHSAADRDDSKWCFKKVQVSSAKLSDANGISTLIAKSFRGPELAEGLKVVCRMPLSGKFKPGNSDSVELSFPGVDIAAEDDVALLLRHVRGVQAMDDEVMHSGEGDLTDLCRAKKITILQWVLMIHSTQQFFGGAAVVTTS